MIGLPVTAGEPKQLAAVDLYRNHRHRNAAKTRGISRLATRCTEALARAVDEEPAWPAVK